MGIPTLYAEDAGCCHVVSGSMEVVEVRTRAVGEIFNDGKLRVRVIDVSTFPSRDGSKSHDLDTTKSNS